MHNCICIHAGQAVRIPPNLHRAATGQLQTFLQARGNLCMHFPAFSLLCSCFFCVHAACAASCLHFACIFLRAYCLYCILLTFCLHFACIFLRAYCLCCIFPAVYFCVHITPKGGRRAPALRAECGARPACRGRQAVSDQQHSLQCISACNNACMLTRRAGAVLPLCGLKNNIYIYIHMYAHVFFPRTHSKH